MKKSKPQPVCLPGLVGEFVSMIESRQQFLREQLEEEMRKPLANITRQSGHIERESPLFKGTGANPTLF